MDVALLVTDGVADLGLAAIVEVFGTANALRDQVPHPPRPWRVRTVAVGSVVRSAHGSLVPTTPLDEVGTVDAAMVPAALVPDADELIETVAAPSNERILEWLAALRKGQVELAAACAGTFFLAEAGVLDGLTATTSWWLGPAMRHRYPRVQVDESNALCRADGITTAGASLMHLDLALSLIASRSPALAELVSRYLVVGDRRTQSSASIPEVMARGDSSVAAFERWVRSNLAQAFGIADAAAAVGMTVRSLQRATQSELGMSPRDFVDEIRLDRATHLLQSTDLTVDAVAGQVGYLNAGTLRSLFRRRRQCGIAEVRGAAPAWRARR